MSWLFYGLISLDGFLTSHLISTKINMITARSVPVET